MRQLERRIRGIARETIAAVPRGEVCNFVDDLAVPLPMLVIAEMLVVRAEAESAVALVTRTKTELALGDRFRGAE